MHDFDDGHSPASGRDSNSAPDGAVSAPPSLADAIHNIASEVRVGQELLHLGLKRLVSEAIENVAHEIQEVREQLTASLNGPVVEAIEDVATTLREREEGWKGQNTDLRYYSELEGIQRAIEGDLCGDIEELRVRVGEVRAAVGSLVIPAYLSAFALIALAYRLW